MASIRIGIVMIFSLAMNSTSANRNQCSKLSYQLISDHDLYRADQKLLAEQSYWTVLLKNLMICTSSGDDLKTDNISKNLCICALSKVQNKDYNDYVDENITVEAISIDIELSQKLYAFPAIRCIRSKLPNPNTGSQYYIIKGNFGKSCFFRNVYDVYLVHSTVQGQYPVDIILNKVPLKKFQDQS